MSKCLAKNLSLSLSRTQPLILGEREAIAYYRSKLEAVVFVWVPPHVGIACNAYADAVATAHLGDNDSEDASKVVRDAVRTRPCMYTVRRLSLIHI